MKARRVESGVPYTLKTRRGKRRYWVERTVCCGCGLRHIVLYEVTRAGLRVTVTLDETPTGRKCRR